MLQCFNRGCGQLFDPENNKEDSCRHHPGLPYFHDAYKGWSCCKKKSVDFTEFLNIKGCTLSPHSNVKPVEPEKPSKEEKSLEEPVIEIREPIKPSLERPSIQSPMIPIHGTVAPALKEAIDNFNAEGHNVTKPKVTPGEVTIGTSCKNSGCTYRYMGTSSDADECVYHSGVPIFHEGLKYWSCCQKKTTDFTVFMSQQGCTYGEHVWFKESGNKEEVKCRYDWHQTGTNVIVSIYAKMYHYQKSVVEVNPVRLRVKLVFPAQNNATFDLDLELRGIIDTEKTTVHMYGTKIEITMPKAEPGSWPKLDFPNTVLPSPQKANNRVNQTQSQKNSVSDDEFNLDDVETINTGIRLSELGS